MEGHLHVLPVYNGAPLSGRCMEVRVLLGHWEQSLAAGSRLTLPPPLREAFAKGCVLTRGLDGGLWLFPAEGWAALAARVAAVPLLHPARRQLERFLFSAAHPCHLDSRGAFTLPEHLRVWAGIQEAAVILGLSEYLELWEPGRWAEREAIALDEAPAAAAALL
jgi:MraZ protein